MSFVVQITDTALADIERNADWWAEHHSVEQALVWLAAVQEQILHGPTMTEDPHGSTVEVGATASKPSGPRPANTTASQAASDIITFTSWRR